MNNIEKLIRENRDHFESFEPSDGHFERFTAKLEARSVAAPKKVSVLPYLLRAATVAILVTLSSLWAWEHVLSPKSKMMTLGEVSPEYREVEQYYVRQVNLMEDEILTIDIYNDPRQKDMLLQELENMDSMYEELKKDLKTNPNDERIINAMIEHYQAKVDVMNYIISQLKEVNSENQINNENYETVRL
ncbi:MAG TPA: hypothetical protein VMW76_05330 [Bacteroidales bacterium]|nr:hypothetical protein [Bacteroidales bacterium]